MFPYEHTPDCTTTMTMTTTLRGSSMSFLLI